MRDVLGWYYINWYIKRVLMRIIEAGLEVYGGMAPQKELHFEHWVRAPFEHYAWRLHRRSEPR